WKLLHENLEPSTYGNRLHRLLGIVVNRYWTLRSLPPPRSDRSRSRSRSPNAEVRRHNQVGVTTREQPKRDALSDRVALSTGSRKGFMELTVGTGLQVDVLKYVVIGLRNNHLKSYLAILALCGDERF